MDALLFVSTLTRLQIASPFGQPQAMPNSAYPPPAFPQQIPGQPGFPPTNPFPLGQLPQGMPVPFPGAPVPFAGSPVSGGPSGLPPRPGFQGVPGQLPAAPFTGGNATAAAVDDLIASVTSQAAKPVEKGKKEKDKNTRLVYSDNDTSPEERLATLSKYAFVAA